MLTLYKVSLYSYIGPDADALQGQDAETCVESGVETDGESGARLSLVACVCCVEGYVCGFLVHLHPVYQNHYCMFRMFVNVCSLCLLICVWFPCPLTPSLSKPHTYPSTLHTHRMWVNVCSLCL